MKSRLKPAPFARISISLPGPLLLELDRLRLDTGLSRSDLIRWALDRLLEGHRKAGRVRAYIQGHKDSPETPQELAEALALALPLLDQEPWP